MKIRKCLPLFMLLIAACTRPASPVQWQYNGGDAKKGIVYLSYDHAEYHDVRAGEAKPLLMADKRCRQLGFAKAARVQGARSECVRTGGLIGTCSVTRTTYEYLCGEYPADRVKKSGKK
ncbi:MAG: YecR family lipoprotein [Neisseria sp.]|uniref:YecR family lipoprotein n=1 Tax=Neisseria sp. TaxID=192066 RepID=UPI0026DDA99B|nr:YecR family lipoprotein [Neisseria sp.]MDO4641843.1 YecR family lipoprotein [Neisseria sp.]